MTRNTDTSDSASQQSELDPVTRFILVTAIITAAIAVIVLGTLFIAGGL